MPKDERLMPIQRVAEMLGCSTRKIYSLVESRMMPAPIRLGGSIRWDRDVIDRWIASGCPSCEGKDCQEGGAQ
ncbi:MAG: helix-turn-helix transcriptional regulator [Thermoguttaceae bacterium]|jgi:prophage regulatory protein